MTYFNIDNTDYAVAGYYNLYMCLILKHNFFFFFVLITLFKR